MNTKKDCINYIKEGNPVVAWFSCGITSAVACKLAILDFNNVRICYCDTLKYEHEDNIRFLKDCERWYKQEIEILKSDSYNDIYDVFNKTKWLNGIYGARCTVELKKKVREEQTPLNAVTIFGMTTDERKRVARFEKQNPDIFLYCPLIEYNFNKMNCIDLLKAVNIDIPMMYKLGYKNNNCIGCVKGGMGYWNKIRDDFPHVFNKMAKLERKINASCINGIFLDELEEGRGNYKSELSVDCGVTCSIE